MENFYYLQYNFDKLIILEENMRIGIDIDGILTNDDNYILDFTSKYCYEHNLKGFQE